MGYRDSDPISLVAVGDICLGLGVRDVIRQYGLDFPFDPCRSILHRADLAFGNLEMVLHEAKTLLKRNHLDFKAPASYGEGLGRAGFRVLSTANNHIMDFGGPACRDTLNFLQRQGVMTTGCGRNLAEARKPAILTVKGKRIGFLAYADDTGQSARPNLPGVAPIRKKYLLEDISALRPQVDITVISLHADLEFMACPAPWRVRLSRQLIEAGADLVLAHHPHVPQGIERYRHGLIAYSLGSFVFPVWGNSYADGRPHMDHSFILRLRMVRHKVLDAQVLPVRINHCHQPVPLTGEDRQEFLQYLRTISLPLGRFDLLDRFWANACGHALGVQWSWLKGIYWEKGWPGVFRRLSFLVRTAENRRWLLGLVPCLVRFGFCWSSHQPQ